MHKNKAKGTQFEYRVKKALEQRGYYVVRQGSSRFPDLIAIPENKELSVMFVECKVNKYISSEERSGLISLKKYGIPKVAWRRESLRDKRKTEIILADENYNNQEIL